MEIVTFFLGLVIGLVILGIGATSIYRAGREDGFELGREQGSKTGANLARSKMNAHVEYATSSAQVDPKIMLHEIRSTTPTEYVHGRQRALRC